MTNIATITPQAPDTQSSSQTPFWKKQWNSIDFVSQRLGTLWKAKT